MDDLIKKLENVISLAKGLLSKPNQNVMVPALKISAPKPLANTQSNESKIPGLTPSSNKDPVKMAQQLKNPRPKKVQVEVLKFEKNGQWNLSDC